MLKCEVGLFTMSHNKITTQAYLCAIWGFFRICCPNRSVLNMGLRTPASPLSWPCEEDPAAVGLMGAWCFRENLSDVARGMLSDQAVTVAQFV